MSIVPFHEIYPGDRDGVDALRKHLIHTLNNHKARRHVPIGTLLIAVSEMNGIVVGTLLDDFGRRAPEAEQEEFKASILAMLAAHIELGECESMRVEE
jgi:hypothetical protein